MADLRLSNLLEKPLANLSSCSTEQISPSLRHLSVLCVSAVICVAHIRLQDSKLARTNHRRDAEDAEMTQRGQRSLIQNFTVSSVLQEDS
jgi:hypothetical protein